MYPAREIRVSATSIALAGCRADNAIVRVLKAHAAK